MATETVHFTPAEILTRVILPADATLSADAARSLLGMRFSPQDRQKMEELLEKAKAGTLSHQDAEDADALDQIGHLLALLHSKARLSLARSASKS